MNESWFDTWLNSCPTNAIDAGRDPVVESEFSRSDSAIDGLLQPHTGEVQFWLSIGVCVAGGARSGARGGRNKFIARSREKSEGEGAVWNWNWNARDAATRQHPQEWNVAFLFDYLFTFSLNGGIKIGTGSLKRRRVNGLGLMMHGIMQRNWAPLSSKVSVTEKIFTHTQKRIFFHFFHHAYNSFIIYFKKKDNVRIKKN